MEAITFVTIHNDKKIATMTPTMEEKWSK